MNQRQVSQRVRVWYSFPHRYANNPPLFQELLTGVALQLVDPSGGTQSATSSNSQNSVVGGAVGSDVGELEGDALGAGDGAALGD